MGSIALGGVSAQKAGQSIETQATAHKNEGQKRTQKGK